MPERMKIRNVIKLIEKNGWYLHRTRGSHRQYKHSYKKGTVTIAGKQSDTLHPKTLKSVLRQAHLGDQ